MEERKIQVRKEQVGYGEEHYLGGKASYKRVVDRFIGNHLVLCNNIVNVNLPKPPPHNPGRTLYPFQSVKRSGR